ncbi:MAG: alpha/beta hydrolase [Deltaproteobacteria bacterium]|nr:alpha/beta hydrolase [Myxococcales bacterium]MDP3216950.1 alpha/beta hydrolase [Deltaproteobacteria bacterium]
MLSYAIVTAPGSAPTRACLVLHGILGSKTNWRTLARRFAEALPDWAFVLVDLREHGASRDLAPPHTLAAAARDLTELAVALPLPVRGVLGHSFGAKVALSYAGVTPSLTHLVVVDANPGARPDRRGSEASLGALDTLEAIGPAWPSREAFVDAVIAAGHDRSMAAWLAMNLEHADAGFRLRIDVTAIRSLLDGYFTADLWSVVEAGPPGRRTTFLLGGASGVMDPPELARLDAVAARGGCEVVVVPGAGHWVHVDAPDATVAAVIAGLSPRADASGPAPASGR